MSSLRLAVIGAGHLGRIHARLAGQLAQAELVAVADPDTVARSEAVQGTGAAAVADYRDVLESIDAAIVATPTSLHHGICAELLQRGLPTLVEKPIASTVPQARELCQLANTRGTLLQVGHVERFNPAFQHVQQQLVDPKFIQAVRMGGFSFRSTDIGVVHDLMIHDLDLVLQLAPGTVQSVSALGVAALSEHEDAAHARIVFDSGCVAEFTASRISYRAERSLQVWCAGQFAALDLLDRNVTTVRPRRAALERQWNHQQLSAEERARLQQTFFSEVFEKQAWQAEDANPILDEQTDFVSSVLGGRPPQVGGEAGLAALELADHISAAIQAHAWDGREGGRRGPLATFRPEILRRAG